MVSSQQLARLPVRAGDHTVPAAARDVDDETRWAAWVERGRRHEGRTGRKLILTAGTLLVGAAVVAIIDALLRP